eukprot:TRINITY_DN105157_c1_g1_i1.p1 TRINITY_DN105157_c1_g1~~TRINITY_DN105157_c1_g1_i1.p1  ORF type:complete len:366 (-),score=40.30 TRINITY_DN105157_c1_g1_i1:802-1806(-)
MRKKNGSGYLIYSKLYNTPYISLQLGKNRLCKEDVQSILGESHADFLERIKEDHIVDIIIDGATSRLEVKNFCSLPVSLRVCSFTKPVVLGKKVSHTFSKITQLSLIFGLGDAFELNIKKESQQQEQTQRPSRKRKRRLRKLIDLVEKNLRAWENMGEGAMTCCICLRELKDTVGKIDCGHMFCPECIECWSDQATYCPLCKKPFRSIKKECDGILIERVRVEEKKFESPEETEDLIVCYECNYGGDEDKLLICDECDINCCHTYCDGLDKVPENSWLCKYCRREFEDLLGGELEQKESIEDIFEEEKMELKQFYQICIEIVRRLQMICMAQQV